MAMKEICRKDISINNNLNLLIDIGERGFICPRCGELTFMEVDTKIFYYEKYPKVIYDCKCDHCGLLIEQTKDQLIDPNIAEAICYLNKAGIRTNYSCEGNDGQNMYISFEDKKILKYSKTMPRYLCLETKKVIASKSMKEFNIEPNVCLRPVFHKPDDKFRSEVLDDIKRWAIDIYNKRKDG